MFAINSPSSKPPSLTPNLLPCAINHNGPIPISDRYWNPQNVPNNSKSTASNPNGTEEDIKPPSADSSVTNTVYFRGRKLHGRTLALPSTHHGLALTKTDTILPSAPKPPTIHKPVFQPGQGDLEDEDEDEDPFRRAAGSAPQAAVEDAEQEVKQFTVQAKFEEVVVWGHEAEPGADDAFMRGVEEWIGFAEAMHRD